MICSIMGNVKTRLSPWSMNTRKAEASIKLLTWQAIFIEWAYDLYEDDIIAQLPDEPPAGPPDGTERSVRGSRLRKRRGIDPFSAVVLPGAGELSAPTWVFAVSSRGQNQKRLQTRVSRPPSFLAIKLPGSRDHHTGENELPDFRRDGHASPEKDLDPSLLLCESIPPAWRP